MWFTEVHHTFYFILLLLYFVFLYSSSLPFLELTIHLRESIGKQNLMTENVIKMFGDAATEHQKKYGTTNEQFAKVKIWKERDKEKKVRRERQESGKTWSKIKWKIAYSCKVAWKNHKHSVNNPFSANQKEYSMEEILDPKTKIYGPLTLFQVFFFNVSYF